MCSIPIIYHCVGFVCVRSEISLNRKIQKKEEKKKKLHKNIAVRRGFVGLLNSVNSRGAYRHNGRFVYAINNCLYDRSVRASISDGGDGRRGDLWRPGVSSNHASSIKAVRIKR